MASLCRKIPVLGVYTETIKVMFSKTCTLKLVFKNMRFQSPKRRYHVNEQAKCIKRMGFDRLSMFLYISAAERDSNNIVPLCRYCYSCGLDFLFLIEVELFFKTWTSTNLFLQVLLICSHGESEAWKPPVEVVTLQQFCVGGRKLLWLWHIWSRAVRNLP